MKQFLLSGAALVGIFGATSLFVPSMLAQSPASKPAQAQVTQSQAKETPPREFDSPDQAVAALIDAASKNDKVELTAILGSTSQNLLTSGNAAQDEKDRQEFSQRASAKHHVERSSVDAETAVLLVGDQDWPFPIPLVQSGQKWHFDGELGAIEMRARRIGANELDAIDICLGYVNAQQQYAARRTSEKSPVTYAQKIMSSPDAKDGLYQKDGGLVPEGLARASWSEPPGNRKPYHGYFFRVLKEQGENAPGGVHKYVAHGAMIGGFALIGWPAQYGVTGIHTFIVNHDGEVFEKDLGPGTATAAPQIVSYDPDKTWTPVDER